MIGEQEQTKEGGTVTLSVKIPIWMADQLNAIAKTRGDDINANHLLALCLQFIVEAAKHDGPIAPEFQTLLNMLKIDASWNNAFNFSKTEAQMDIAQCILILQQHNGKKPRNGFGLMMIDKPFMGEATYTTCVDDILERVIKVSMPGLHKRLEAVGKRLLCQSQRETMTLLSEYMNDSLDKEEEQHEMPGYGEYNVVGRAIEYGNKQKSIHHRTPDSLANSQQKIIFDDFDRDIANDEADGGEHIGEHVSPEEIEQSLGVRPFDVES